MNAPSKRVLIVEDETAYAGMVCMRLELDGFECRTACDTECGIREIGAGGYDLIVLDLMLPGEGGIAVLDWLVRNANGRPPRVVVLTGQALTPELRSTLESFGVSALFAKPYDPVEFTGTIRRLLSPQ
jgi:two-component system, OmpR family, response regulator